jgi:hypothetical protein
MNFFPAYQYALYYSKLRTHCEGFHQQGVVSPAVAKQFMRIVWNHYRRKDKNLYILVHSLFFTFIAQSV